MATDCIAQTTFRFQQNSKPVLARFDVAHASSDGGAVLLKAIDAQLRLTEQLADTLRDPRQSGKIRHQGIELLRQRVFGVACGYADCNDAARLADDPIHKLLVDRDPLTGAALGSQPTLSRFENGVRRGALYALGEALADTVIASHQRRLTRRPVRRITIDLDPTDDPTHGQQELAFFNGHYDTWCYLPLMGTLTFNDERIQYLVAAVLRPGTGPTARGAIGRLRRLFAKLRTAFPTARLRVRLDGGFAGNPLLDFLEAERVEYVIGLAGNVRVEKRARRLMGRARVRSRASGETEHLFGETRYAAKKWSHQRRVIMTAEVVRHPSWNPKILRSSRQARDALTVCAALDNSCLLEQVCAIVRAPNGVPFPRASRRTSMLRTALLLRKLLSFTGPCLVAGVTIGSAHAQTCPLESDFGKVSAHALSMGRQEIPYELKQRVRLLGSGGPIRTVQVQSTADLQMLQRQFPTVIASVSPLPGSDCNNRYSSGSYHLSPSAGGHALGSYNVTYEKWKCVSADVPCPTWSKPLRFCRKTAHLKLFQKTLRVTLDFSVSPRGEDLNVAVAGRTDAGHLPTELAFVGLLVGGPSGAIVGGAFGTSLSDSLKRRAAHGSIPIVLPVHLSDEGSPITFTLARTSFTDLGHGKLGLLAEHETRPLRENTACFVRNLLVDQAS